MVVGEMPGREEDRASSPFVGAGGRLVRSCIAHLCQRLGVDAERVFYTYAVRCRGESAASQAELDQCVSWLGEEIYSVKPRHILALGRTAHAQVEAVSLSMADGYFEAYEYPEDITKAYAPGYILKNKHKLAGWLDQLEIAIRRAFSLSESIHRGGEITANSESWTFGEPDLSSKWLAADTETDDLAENFSPDKVGWSLSDGSISTFRIDETPPLPHVYLHNAKYDLAKLGIDPDDLERWDCTMLQAYCLRKYERVGLKELGPKLTGIHWDATIKDLLREYIPSGAVFKSGPRKGQEKPGKWVKAPFSRSIATRWEDASRYAATDAVVTSRLSRALDQEMQQAPWARHYYLEYEKPLLPVLLSMEQAGVRVDPSAMHDAESVILAKRSETEARLREVFGADINLASGQQMGPVLYDMGIVDGKRTDSGDLGVGKPNILNAFHVEKMEDLPNTDEGRIAHDLLEWRQMGKLKSTYVDALLSRLDPQSRVHGRYNQSGTTVNRLSSSDPNLQNIPSRSKIGMAIRRAFVPADGCVLVGGDFSQLQPRIWAELTRDPVFVRAYTLDEKGDIYLPVAEELAEFGVDRQGAKPIVLGGMYGGGDATLGRASGVPVERMGPFLMRLHERMPSIKEWPVQIGHTLSAQGYVESIMGWRMFFPDYAGMVNQWSSAALREAANAPIISSEAGLVKVFMRAVYLRLKSEFPLWRLVLQVHDELWAEGPEREADAVMQMMKETATEVARRFMSIPVRFDTKTVTSWGLAK